MSSANSLALLLRESGNLLIKARKRQGPSTDRWGTPDMTGTDEDCLPSATTNWGLSLRNDLTKDTVLRFKPKLNSLYILISCGLLYQMFC